MGLIPERKESFGKRSRDPYCRLHQCKIVQKNADTKCAPGWYLIWDRIADNLLARRNQDICVPLKVDIRNCFFLYRARKVLVGIGIGCGEGKRCPCNTDILVSSVIIKSKAHRVTRKGNIDRVSKRDIFRVAFRTMRCNGDGISPNGNPFFFRFRHRTYSLSIFV